MRIRRIQAFWILPLVIVVLAVTGFGLWVKTSRAGRSNTLTASANSTENVVTRSANATDRRIETANRLIQRSPSDVRGYNQLCAAFMQKARETGDFGFNARAEAAVKRSLEVSSDVEDKNFDALKLQTTLLLTYHRFGEALTAARRAQQIRPQDHQVYGMLTDALVELGDYPAAVEAADKMAELRPSAASYARVSYLRSLHGYNDPAIEAMRMAVRASSPSDAEGYAWCRVHLGDELMNVGRRAEAEREYDDALLVFPEYHMGLAAKARARAADGELQQAVEYYERAQKRVPLPETAAALGDLYTKLGRAEDAKRQYELVEVVERSGGGTYSRQLALFWADHDMRLDEALAIAKSERAARADIYTSDALAWCLFKKGDIAAAKPAITEALRLGTRDARLYYHAGMIHHAAGEKELAVKCLKLALATNASFDLLQADVARRTLKDIAQ